MLKTAIYSVFILSTSFFFGQTPEFSWGFGSGASIFSVTSDSNNDLYVTGAFGLSVDFDPGAASNILTSNGQSDIFVAKYSSDGNLVWAKSIGSSDYDQGRTIKLFNNELIIGGVFNLTVDFDPGSQTNSKTSSGGNDIFILKMTTDGDFIDVEKFGGAYLDDFKDLTLDNAGNILFTGQYSYNGYFNPDDPNLNVFALGMGIFVCKVSNGLIFDWVKTIATNNPSGSGTPGYYDVGVSIRTNSAGHVFVLGLFEQTLDFNPGAGTFNLTANSLYGSFLLHLNYNGDFFECHLVPGWAFEIDIDSNDNLYQTGNFTSASVDFDPGPLAFNLPLTTGTTGAEGYLRKFSPSGLFEWAMPLGANNGDAKHIDIDLNQDIYISSSFEGTVDLDPTSSIFNCTSVGWSNAFITKINSQGQWYWSVFYGNISPGVNTNTFVRDLHVDSGLGIISAGDWVYNGTVIDLDPGNGQVLYTASDNFHRYFQKLQSCVPTYSAFDTIVCSQYTAPDGVIYNASGTYTATIPNAAGCDSIITINLTINQPTSSSISPQACGSYTAPDGQVYTVGGNYTATIPNVAGCDSTISINLSILPLPMIDAGVDQTICEGTSVTLTASGGNAYSWDNGVVNAVPFTPTSTLTYTVTGTNASGCTNTDQVTVTVNPLPVISFDADQLTGCVPLTVNFSNTTPNGQLCSWTFGNGMSSSDCAPSITFEDEGCFDVSLTVSNSFGCSSSAVMNDAVCATPEPVAGIITTSLSITDNQPVTFTNTSSGATDYAWNLGDGSPITTTEDVVHIYQLTNEDSITIQLIAYSASGCSDTATLILPVNDSGNSGVTIPTGFSPNNDGENDTWTVGGLENYPDAVIQVYNRWGQVLFEGDQANPTWNGYFQGNLLPTGDYYYIVDLGNDEKLNGVVTLKQ